MHASCESPWHSLAKHCILDTCFLLTVPFRGMLLTPQGGPRCLAPTAHQIPVYLMVFSTFLCRAFTAHYLYTQWCDHIPPLYFTAHHAEGIRPWGGARESRRVPLFLTQTVPAGVSGPQQEQPPGIRGLLSVPAQLSSPE